MSWQNRADNQNDRSGPFQPLPDLLSTASSSAQWGLKPAFAPSAQPEAWNRDVARLAELPAFVAAFKACCDVKRESFLLLGHRPSELTAGVGGELPSPPPESAPGSAREGEGKPEEGQVYYRPSRDVILAVLRRKVAHVAAHFQEFDHLVRALGRDGLLGADADAKLVEGELHLARGS